AIAATRSTITLELPPAEQAERERVMGIMAAGRTLRLELEASEMIARGVSLDEANRALLARAAERQYAEQIAGVGARVQGGISYDDPEVRRRAMADALAARICRTAPPEGQAREFMALSVIEMARETLVARGIHVGRNPGEVWTRVGALHTTSDFALLLADAQNKSLRQMYEAAESGVRVAARQTTARDFKTIHRLQSGEFPLPEKVNEHGEFTRGT